jgi:cardiolipin synthase A/B
MQVKKFKKSSSFLKRKCSIFLFISSVALVATFFISVIIPILNIPLPSKEDPLIFYSNHLATPLRHLTIKVLRSALFSIKIHTYSLTDDAVIETLLVKKQSIDDIEVLTDVKTIPSSFSLLQKPFKWKQVKSSGLMHEKILLIDKAMVFLGTANMTYESLCMHDNFIIGMYHPQLAQHLLLYTQAIDEKKKHKNTSHTTFSFQDQLLELWMLPYKGNAPLDRLKTLIQNASFSVQVAMFTLTHPELLKELSVAHERGVFVQVFLDHTSAHGASSQALQTLLEAKIPVYLSTGLQLLHHKIMLIDQTCFVLGSANWTKSAFKKNHDFYLTLSPLKPKQTKLLRTVFKKIKQESTLASL